MRIFTMSPERDPGILSGTTTAVAVQTALADLLACVAAFARSLQHNFDPQHFLAEFSARAQRLVPHDRMLIAYVEDRASTYTVFAENAGSGPPLHEGRYTTEFDPTGRYALDDWDLGAVFAGQTLLIEDVERDSYWAERPTGRARLLAVGIRARIGVPLYAGGRVIGAFVVGNLTPRLYSDAHVAACRQIADLMGPFIEGVVQLHRERYRRGRLRAVSALAPILGASFRIADLLERLGEALRSILDFDAMAIRVVRPDRRDLELVGVLDTEEGPRYAGMAAPHEYSTSDRIARGETVLSTTRNASSIPSVRATAGFWTEAGARC